MGIFDLTIISDPTVLDYGNLLFKSDFSAYAEYDVNLVKSAVLVADQIDLRSIREEVARVSEAEFGRFTYMPLQRYLAFVNYSAFPDQGDSLAYPVNRSLLAPEEEALAERERVIDFVGSGGLPDIMGTPFHEKYVEQMNELTDELSSFFYKKRHELNSDDMKLLRELDSVSLDGWFPAEEDREEQVFRITFSEQAGPYWSSLGNALPDLIDASSTTSLMLSGVGLPSAQAGTDTLISSSPTSPASIATSVMTGLPSFQRSSLAQVLDLREDLGDFLPNFRGEMIDLSDAIEAKGVEDSAAVQYELEKAWYQKIAPQLVQMRAIAKGKSYPRTLLDEIANDGASQIATGASVVIAAGGLVAGLSVLLPAAVGVALPFVKAYNQRLKDRDDLKSNRLFFLHEVDRRLSKKSKR
ncbi:hypothetical protein [Rhodococcus sp. B7740]|uniref:hypothetical protein n=1 Tax=Rhodococcus sp. B7740 TaxID=1564114 RepID=UPI0005EB465E|nr:hypothetical protein [Rhodococcus sp. B7740]